MEILNFYKNELQRIAWRLHYKARIKRKRECRFIEEIVPRHHAHENQNKIHDRMMVQELLEKIPSDIGRKVIHDLFIKDRTEAQLAKELNISQQAVNKWKRKTLHLLSQKLSS